MDEFFSARKIDAIPRRHLEDGVDEDGEKKGGKNAALTNTAADGEGVSESHFRRDNCGLLAVNITYEGQHLTTNAEFSKLKEEAVMPDRVICFA